jgi:hypothetical protein
VWYEPVFKAITLDNQEVRGSRGCRGEREGEVTNKK